jgi:cell wall-associated NlpC family hydrolase
MGLRICLLIAFIGLLGSLAGCGSLPDQRPGRGDDEARFQVVVTAAAMLGTPYLYGGSTPDEGFDCSGLVQYSYAQAGIRLPRTTLELYRESRPIRIGRLKPGDVLFFKLNGRRVSHVGIYLGDQRFIHAPKTGKDVSISSLNNRYWRRHLVTAGRLM